MKITFLGHAGLFIETSKGSILSDPWFNPAYFASWFPFPSNDHLDLEAISHPDFLYVSHLHYDHLDVKFLRQHVDKRTTIILPDYPLPLLRERLENFGFTNFLQTKNLQPVEVGGLRLTVASMVAPTDGPIGDSGLIIDDGVHRLYDQNDSRPIDIDTITALGPLDAHFVQFSGAIWYPFVYDYPPQMMAALGRKKRENEMARAARYIDEFDARWVFPSAGPPCFLDTELFEINDFERDPTNTFPDQSAFLDYLAEHGRSNGRLALPGTVIELTDGEPLITHPWSEERIKGIFAEKRSYLEEYQERWQLRLDGEKAAWPRGRVEILPALKEWFEPLMERADITCAGINGVVFLDLGQEKIALDFHQRVVRQAEPDEEWDYCFEIDSALIEHCILVHAEDWVNELFLSCRFRARRKGAFNEYVYNFFKCLSMERLQYAEGFYAEKNPVEQFWEAEGYRIQRRCPHLKADLTKFGKIENGVLTCTLHGWQFELATGKCLTSDDRRLYAKRLDEVGKEVEEQASPVAVAGGASVRTACGHCRYDPKNFPAKREENRIKTPE